MAKSTGQSRTGRRIGTKSARRKACQAATKGVLRRAKRAANRPASKRKIERPGLHAFQVRNVGTKREITVMARDVEHAFEIAMTEHKLAKSVEKLRATGVAAEVAA